MWERKPENRLDDPGSYLAQTRSQAIAAKILDEIIRLKELCSHMDIIVRRLIISHCFCDEAVREQLNEDKPRLFSVYMYSNSAIIETE